MLTGTGLVLDILNLIFRILATDDISSILYWVTDMWLPRWVLSAYLFFVVWSFKNEIEDEAGVGEDYQGKVHYSA